MTPVVIMGCGYVGERLARTLQAGGRRVLAVVRSADHAGVLRTRGIETLQADLDTGEGLDQVPLMGALVLHSVPPPNQGQEDPRTQRLAAACRRNPPERIVYLSTTGVYGDRGGATVDDLTPTAPATDRAHRRLDAEGQLRALEGETGVPVVVLRVPGIYGPGRLPLAAIRAGQPLIRPEEAGPGNRIHVDDLVALCAAALDHGPSGETYNVGDGDHRSMTAFFQAVADAAGLPHPPCMGMAEAEGHLSPMMLSFLRESRTVQVARGLADLGVQLRYPRMEAGIRASLEEEAAGDAG
ncbi:NAD-dependent epimerase/dehydratase family protein [Ectothiorhodospira mobilis]|uniref:NAD-dependent epimerase/dehydratase family protein n=1 Tax=Ectothiorhodospira mobilis TaxID=195064 RepID=UPI0019046C90|nr:NAD-dependent epimerase/dehydratase family protein [Ectothiorhodospira mobilis]MBK1692040.1 NAD(P)-dependent oxidoreductase [Ectothiorhodospira mobilis]